MNSKDIKLGDLVWAKMKGFSPWPGKVCKPRTNMPKPKSSKVMHCIWFFGSNNFAWIEEYNIKQYLEFKEKLSKTCKTSLFKKACAEIEDYIRRKELGEDVDSQFDEKETTDEVLDELSNEDIKDEDDEDEDLDSASEVNTSQEDDSQKDPSFNVSSSSKDKISGEEGTRARAGKKEDNSDEKKSLSSETGSASPRKTKKRPLATSEIGNGNSSRASPKKTRRASQSVPAEKKGGTPKIANHAPRKSAAASLLDRPSELNRPHSAPVNVGHVSQTLKDKQITPSKMKFGFLGLGIMGSGMVKNLINSGHAVVVWNRTPEKCKDFVSAGADQGMTPSDVVLTADITFSCVSDPQAAKEMVFGNCGVLQEMDPSKAYVEMTGTDSETSEDVSNAIGTKGGRYMEAQVQGSKTESEEGTLVILAAGDRSLYEDCQSAFQAMGKHSFYLGETGNASRMNLVIQLINGIMLGGLAEGMALADRAGLQQRDVLEILSLTNIACPLVRDKGQAIMDANFPAHQPLQHMQKDLNLALGMGHSLEQPLPLAATANEVFKHAKRLGYGEHDAAAVYIRARF